MTLRLSTVVLTFLLSGIASAQPEPYHVVDNWIKLPDGRIVGAVSAIDVDHDDNIWVFERCGGNTCIGSTLNPVLKINHSGHLLSSFGAGMFVYPHGIYVDAAGDVWVVDGKAEDGKGQQVLKFTPEGKLLMALGKAGVTGNGPDTFNEPNAVVVAPNGDIFVCDGHNPGKGNARVMKFTKDGEFLKQWGGHGDGPGQFEKPHALAFDSSGRLYVGDVGNNRIQIFDQDGTFLSEWKQFGQPSGIFIDTHDTIYVADSGSSKPGIRVGNTRGEVTAFIPALGPAAKPTSATEGVAVDSMGNIYGAEVGTRNVRKYAK
jgi:sugar lactone lactonase YvrE